MGHEKERKYIDVCPLSLDPAMDPPSIQICTKVGRRRYDLSFQNEHKKLKQNAITINNNNESKNIHIKTLLVLLLRLCCVLYLALNGLWLIRRCKNINITYSLNQIIDDAKLRHKCLFDLVLYVPSTIFQLYRYRSSCVEPVLSWD